MANVKNASIREIVIDRCLQTRGRRTVQQIISYGKRMKVITTQHLKEDIVENLKENLKNYQ